jgi:DNA repair exonuclease SbcCD ATPase subunit
MILFKTIRYKNFLGSGNQCTEIDLITNKTNLIIGTNGSGKSCILDALCFSLFGKPYRKINKPQLVNSINEKDCVVEIEFTIGTTEWRVTRGIKPSIFDIIKNGEKLNQLSDSIDQQKWLEQNVLKMSYKSFTQVVILGSSAYVPFMELTASNRREIIEDLLDIKIFTSMNVVIKDRIRKVKDELKTLELKKESLHDKIEMQKQFIEEIENRGKENISSKMQLIQNLNIEIEIYMRESGVLEETIFEKNKELQEYLGSTNKLKKLETLKGKLSQKVSTISKDHKFFVDNTVCPTCTQTIDDEFRNIKITEFETKSNELQSKYQELKELIQEEEGRENLFSLYSKEIAKVTNEISQNNVKISSNQKQVQNLEKDIEVIMQQLQNKNEAHEKLEEFQNNHQNTYDEIISKKDLTQYYDFTYNLLKDGGVKTKIIKKYLPIINQKVNSYLQLMDFYINFIFDEEFNESVQTPIHEKFSYGSFSEGEKARINLSLIFSWRDIAKMKNSINCNIIFFDEVFDGALDSTGTDDFLKIIRYIIKDANIFVISHKSGLDDKFDKVLKFEKIKGFSLLVS